MLKTLAAYEIIWDFLDSINERSATAGVENGVRLHISLADALDASRQATAYFEHCCWHDDGGYLQGLVKACRANCSRAPSFALINTEVVRRAIHGQVCAINHDPETVRRDAALASWAKNEFPSEQELSWFELTAAASTNLTIFALLALSTARAGTSDQVKSVAAAYFPWACALAALLDSYVDQEEDAATAHHSCVTHYSTADHATRRICQLIHRCILEARALDDGERHAVIVASMFAMYLSKRSATTPAMLASTKRMVAAGGSLTRFLHPILRLWRTAYGLRAV